MNVEEQGARIALSHVRGISRKRLAFYISEWQKNELGRPLTRAFWTWLNAMHPVDLDWGLIERDRLWCVDHKVSILMQGDAHYPEWLRHIQDAPLILYAQGKLSLLSTTMIAIVGSRRPSLSGESLAYKFGLALAEAGLCVVSGLALGIDGKAHEGALAAPFGHTVAVLGSGFASLYPRRHEGLAHRIVERGVLLSEYGPFAPPLPTHFPERNRIISGLSRGVLVIEAGLKSGSLITARLALEQNREVMALPGSLANPLSEGSHRLIQEGAMLVTQPSDILNLFGFGTAKDASLKKAAEPTVPEDLGNLLKCVAFEVSTPIADLVQLSGLAVENVASKLMALELLGAVATVPGGYIRV
jgi:DNA processing protein